MPRVSRVLVSRIVGLFRTHRLERQVDDELDEEFQEHLKLLTERFTRRGMEPPDALQAARRQFGGVIQLKEELRDRHTLPLADALIRDLRYGWRSLRRHPLFTLTALLTLALTIGAVSAVLMLIHAYFLQPLPADHPEQIVSVVATRRHGTVLGSISYPDYLYLRDRTRTLKGLAAHYSTAPLFVTAGEHASEINGAVVTANFFPMLGIHPALGRFFNPEEDRVPDRDRVAILGHDLWREWFGASASAIGATVTINGVPFSIIGVAPGMFHGIDTNPARIYIPTMMLAVGYRSCSAALSEECTILDMIGRLAEGKRISAAAAEMTALIAPRWQHAAEGDNTGITVFPPRPVHHSDSEARFVTLLLLVAAVLLLVGCANLAGLLTARGMTRIREFAIRTSLGASRLRLLVQLLMESVLLALLGGVAGLLLSVELMRLLRVAFYAADAEGHPIYFDFTLKPPVILAVFLTSVLAGLVFGLLPALNAIRVGPSESLKRRSSSLSRYSRVGPWLVGGQAVAAVALASMAMMLVDSARVAVGARDIESSRVALMRLRPRLIQYGPARAQAFQRAVVRRLEALPQVESVSLIGTGIVVFGGGTNVSLPGWKGADANHQGLVAGYGEIGPRYFDTLGSNMVLGREFNERDIVDSPLVAIVSEALVHRVWPAGGVIGSTLITKSHLRTVVGIARDIKPRSRAESIQPYVYTPYWQNPAQVDSRVCVRVKGDAAAALPDLVREVHAIDPAVPIAETITLPIQMAGIFRPLRMSAAFVGYASVLAVGLSFIGLYGLLTFSVSCRRREMAICVALGADAGRLTSEVVRQGFAAILPGILMGLCLAAIGSRFVQHLLYAPGVEDRWLYAAAAALVAAGSLAACWGPARRAAGLDPALALRDE